MHLKKDAWRWFDELIELAEKYQLYVILDLHAVAGSQNEFDHSGRKDWNKLWGDRVYWDRLDTVELPGLGPEVYAGLFCVSHDNEALATAKFRDVKIQQDEGTN